MCKHNFQFAPALNLTKAVISTDKGGTQLLSDLFCESTMRRGQLGHFTRSSQQRRWRRSHAKTLSISSILIT